MSRGLFYGFDGEAAERIRDAARRVENARLDMAAQMHAPRDRPPQISLPVINNTDQYAFEGAVAWVTGESSDWDVYLASKADYPVYLELAVLAEDLPGGCQGEAWLDGVHDVLVSDYADVAVGDRLTAQSDSWYAVKHELGPLIVVGKYPVAMQRVEDYPSGVGVVRAQITSHDGIGFLHCPEKLGDCENDLAEDTETWNRASPGDPECDDAVAVAPDHAYGVVVTMLTRVAIDYDQQSQLHVYCREFSFDSVGRLVAVGPEVESVPEPFGSTTTSDETTTEEESTTSDDCCDPVYYGAAYYDSEADCVENAPISVTVLCNDVPGCDPTVEGCEYDLAECEYAADFGYWRPVYALADGSACIVTTTEPASTTTEGETSTAEETTGEESTGEDTTGEYTTGEDTTGEDTTGEYTTGEYTTGETCTGAEETTGEDTTGEDTTGETTTPPGLDPYNCCGVTVTAGEYETLLDCGLNAPLTVTDECLDNPGCYENPTGCEYWLDHCEYDGEHWVASYSLTDASECYEPGTTTTEGECCTGADTTTEESTGGETTTGIDPEGCCEDEIIYYSAETEENCILGNPPTLTENCSSVGDCNGAAAGCEYVFDRCDYYDELWHGIFTLTDASACYD